MAEHARPAALEPKKGTSWKDIAGYCAVIAASIGMGALSGYYDAVHLGVRYDKMIQEVNAISYSQEMFERGMPKIYQTSLQSCQFTWGVSFLQWFASWYARRTLVIGVREESERPWVKRSLGMMSFLAAWTAYAISYSLLRKSPAVLNVDNFKHWKI